MTDLYPTPESRRAEYDRIARVLDAVRVSRTAHIASGAECGAEPLCAGPDGMDLLLREFTAGTIRGAGKVRIMLLVAVGEMARLTGELAVMHAERDDALATAMRLDADLLDAQGALATAEEQLAAWDAAADVLGPVGMPDDR